MSDLSARLATIVALHRIDDALTPHGTLFIDGGGPLRRIDLPARS